MPGRDISPVPDSPNPQGPGHYQAEDDIELPPMPESGGSSGKRTDLPNDNGDARKSKGISSVLGGVAMIAALVVGGLFMTQSGSEKGHPNWPHVAAAADASNSDASPLVHLDAAGNSQVVPAIEVSVGDIDRNTTRQIRTALQRSDLMTANALIQAAQKMPSASQDPDVKPPQIVADSELAVALREGRELFQIELFDCCDEDGDIVEVLVNGASFATVPIMHRGTMLSVPLERGTNTVTIRGVKDGGGGVTLSFRTSRGEYFARSMRVGEECALGVVVR